MTAEFEMKKFDALKREVLEKYLTSKLNILKFEKILKNKNQLYDCVGLISNGDCGVQEIYNLLKSGNFGWNHVFFKDLKQSEIEEDDFLENPPEVEEGAFQCKCGSKKVYTFSKQSRSGDESTTVFAMCSFCKKKWIL